MQTLRPVTVDLATGVVTLGGKRVALQREGEHYAAFGGIRARALTFEERSGVVAGALIDAEPNRALLTKLRNLANISGDCASELTDALALALAGGGEPAPSFAECARSACRNASLDWQTVQQTPAVVVDQLVSEQKTSGGDDAWTRFEFREAPETEASLEECCRYMLERLLERGTPQESAEEQEATTGARAWPSQTKLRALHDDVQADGLNSGKPETSAQPKFAWPRGAQATFRRAEPPSRDAAPKVPNPPSPVGAALRATSGWPQEPPSQADADVSRSGGNGGAVSVASGPTSDWRGTASASIRQSLTVWDTDPAEAQAHEPTPVQTSNSAPVRTAAPISAKARLRAHRLRDLPVRSQKLAQPPRDDHNPQSISIGAHAPTMSDVTMSELLPSRCGSAPRDWLYEIATALSDECDLRGLDA